MELVQTAGSYVGAAGLRIDRQHLVAGAVERSRQLAVACADLEDTRRRRRQVGANERVEVGSDQRVGGHAAVREGADTAGVALFQHAQGHAAGFHAFVGNC